MDLEVEYSKVKNQEQAFEKVKANITADTIKKFNVNATLDYQAPHAITASGRGFTLNLYFNDISCEVDADLSLLLRPMKGKILSTLEKELKRVL